MEWGEEIDCSCICGTESVFLFALLFLVLVCIYSIVVWLRSCVSKSPSDGSLDGCCSYSRGAPQSPNCQSSCNVLEKMDQGEMEDDRGMIVEDECVVCIRNLFGRLVLIFIRAGVLVCAVVVVDVGVVFFGERFLSVTDVECLGVGW